MFYLSSGILNNLYKRINLRKGAIELPYKCEIFPKMQKYKQENPMIVKVVDIIFFEHEKVLGMELFDDGVPFGNYPVLLDQNKWHFVNSEYFKTDNTDEEHPTFSNLISVGSVLIIKEYTFEDVDIVDNKGNNLPENIHYYLQDILIIKDFFIVGFDIF